MWRDQSPLVRSRVVHCAEPADMNWMVWLALQRIQVHLCPHLYPVEGIAYSNLETRARSEPVMGWLGAVGVNRNGGGGGRSGETRCLIVRKTSLSQPDAPLGKDTHQKCLVSMDLPHLSTMLCPSPGMCLRAATYSCSDLPKSSRLPAVVDTGCLRLGESLWPHFLVDESRSIPWGTWWCMGIRCASYWVFHYPNVRSGRRLPHQ